MEANFYIDELLKKLIEMKKDGYCYCSVCFMDTSSCPEDGLPWICFDAIDDGGFVGMGYEFVDSVPDEEISEFAYFGMSPNPERLRVELFLCDD